MTKFSLFKKTMPVIMLSTAPQAFSLDIFECSNWATGTVLQFSETALTPGKDYAFFDHLKFNGDDLYNGSGAIMGKGVIQTNKISLDLTYTPTGADSSSNIGRLVGKKTLSGWEYTLVPWNDRTEKLEPTKAVTLNQCSRREL